MSCGQVSRNNTLIVNSDNIIWNGQAIPVCLNLPSDATFNDILYALATYVCQISVPSESGTDDVLTDAEYTICASRGYTVIPIGTSLTDVLSIIVACMCSIVSDIVSINNEIITINDYIDNSILVGNGGGVTSIVLPPMTVLGNIGNGVEPVDRDGLIFIEKLVNYNDTYKYIHPYTSDYHFAVGDGTTTTKRLLSVLNGSLFSEAPSICWGSENSLGISGFTSFTGFSINQNAYSLYTQGSLFYGKATKSDRECQLFLLNYDLDVAIGGYSYFNHCVWNWKYIGGHWDDSSAYLALELTTDYVQFNIENSSPVFKINVDGLSILGTHPVFGIINEEIITPDPEHYVPTWYLVKDYVNTLIPATPALQRELDATQVGIGCNTNGTYNTPIGTTYLNSTTSVMNALVKLDTELNRVESLPLTANGAGALRQIAVYDFDYSDQPLTGDIELSGNKIPKYSIITNVWIDVIDAFLSDETIPNTTELTIGFLSPNDINDSLTVGSFYTEGIKTQDVLSFNTSSPIKLTVDRSPRIGITNGAGAVNGLIQGSMRIFIEYLNSR